jgi:hypothetical protein
MSAANAGITKSPEPSIEESEIMTTPQRPMVRLKTEVNSPLALEILSVKIEVDGFLDRERPHFVVKNQFNRMMIIVSQNQPHLWFWVEINDLRGIWSLKLVQGYPPMSISHKGVKGFQHVFPDDIKSITSNKKRCSKQAQTCGKQVGCITDESCLEQGMSGANGSLKLNHMGLGSGDWYVRHPVKRLGYS